MAIMTNLIDDSLLSKHYPVTPTNSIGNYRKLLMCIQAFFFLFFFFFFYVKDGSYISLLGGKKLNLSPLIPTRNRMVDVYKGASLFRKPDGRIMVFIGNPEKSFYSNLMLFLGTREIHGLQTHQVLSLGNKSV